MNKDRLEEFDARYHTLTEVWTEYPLTPGVMSLISLLEGYRLELAISGVQSKRVEFKGVIS